MDNLYSTGIRNPYSRFNGNVNQYKYLHVKVSKAFGKPRKCEECGTTEAKRYDWANLGENYGYPYVVRREDWRRLCRSCHQKLDADLFVGKRFAGKKHSSESKSKTSATLKKFWAEHPEKYQQVLATKAEKRRLKNVSL